MKKIALLLFFVCAAIVCWGQSCETNYTNICNQEQQILANKLQREADIQRLLKEQKKDDDTLCILRKQKEDMQICIAQNTNAEAMRKAEEAMSAFYQQAMKALKDAQNAPKTPTRCPNGNCN